MSDNHGNTPAAWTAVVVALIGFAVGGVGLIIDSSTTFWIGVVMVPLSLMVLGALNKMGYGTSRH